MRRCIQVWASILLVSGLSGNVAQADKPAASHLGKPAVRAAKLLRPRMVSAAERAAIEMVAEYLQHGPEVLWDRLASGSPWRKLGRESAIREIAARMGPADGATWQLLTPGPSFDNRTAILAVEFASGLDDTLVFHMTDEKGWKLREIRTSVEPVAIKPSFAGTATSVEDLSRRRRRITVGAAILLLILGTSGASLLTRARKRGAAVAVMALALAASAGAVLWPQLSARPQAAAPPKPVALVRLGELAPLHNALASGSDLAEIERRLAVRPQDPTLRNVVELWRAQYLLGEAKLPAVELILRSFPPPTAYPLAELLRARLAFSRLQREPAAKSYDRLIDDGLDHDGIRLELASVNALTNEIDLAGVELTLMVEMGSRLAESWYAAAQVAAAEDQMEDAEALLRRAWQLQPAPRSELFSNPLLTAVVARPQVFPLFALGHPEEPRVVPEGEPRPLILPESASAATCGQSLRLVFGTAELLVPGGADLAPANTVLEDAEVWSRHAEEKALAALPTLTGEAAAGASLQPRRLRLAEQAGRALAEQNRWTELLAVTEPIAAKVEKAPAILVRLRAQALHHLDRDEEARKILIRLAKTDLASRRPAPATLIELAELFAATGEYDTAIKLSQKADSQLPEPLGERRRKQLALERDLAQSYVSYRSEHFDVRYPKATGEIYARGVAQVLEEERRRLQRWIPETGGKPLEVHLFSIQEFMSSFGGDMGVVGVFDGKVRVPFADLRSLHPLLVSILSHELAHAMIAARTRDQAPHWLQEGLAVHVEMGLGRLNPLPDLARTGRALSFPTVDLILRGFAEEQFVDLAYAEAAWTVQFIEARWGVKAIHRLLAAFAAGKTTEQALREVCGVSLAEFDRALWQWGTTVAPSARNVEVRRYDKEYFTQVVHEQGQREDRTAPRIGVNEEIRARSSEDRLEGQRRAMAAWHAIYTARTSAVKRALTPILQIYQGNATGSPARSCSDLATSVARALADPEPWSSPDPGVNRALRNAYQLLGKLADACGAGRDTETRVLINQASQALGNAARLLAPYGLTP